MLLATPFALPANSLALKKCVVANASLPLPSPFQEACHHSGLPAMQVTVSMLCSDGGAPCSSILAINAVSAALMCSHIPWNGPLAAVQVAYTDAEAGVAVQPTAAQLQTCSMSGIYVGTADSTLLADFQVNILCIVTYCDFMLHIAQPSTGLHPGSSTKQRASVELACLNAWLNTLEYMIPLCQHPPVMVWF